MLRRSVNLGGLIKRNVSALYVTGDKAMENFAVLSPFLEIDERMNKFNEIEENIARRKLPVNLNELKSEYELFASVERRKKELEDRRVEIAAQMKKEATEGLKLEGKDLREKLKKLKENSYHLEDQFVHNFLQIPNEIHAKTPSSKTPIYNFLEKPSDDEPVNDRMHEQIEFFDPTCYYMRGDAAKFDLQVMLDVSDYYKEAGYVKISSPDFVRSIVPEAAAVESKDVFLLKEDDIENKLNLLHLTGSGSMLNYLPYIAKLLVFPTQLPLRLISTGRNYNSLNHLKNKQDLYEVVQTTCCQTFIATRDSSSFDETIESQIEHLRKIFGRFNRHFRIVAHPPGSLAKSEAYRLGVEMFSGCRREYIEVGNFSYHSDFISKRLLFNYKLDGTTKFPHIYFGTVNVMKLLVNLVESNSDLSKFV
jgi:seryl-tRNA synthetase